MNILQGAIRTYAWGSRTAIAQLMGRSVPSPHPEAELWFGAHHADSAQLVTDGVKKPLIELLSESPITQLGDRCHRNFGDQLPFLLKVLAAEEPLSLQAHPSAQQALEGFAREEELKVPLDSNTRNYRDNNHKPELVVALTQFEALAGFRQPSETIDLLRALAIPELAPYVELLVGQPDSDGLRALFTTWITLPRPTLDALLPKVIAGCIDYLAQGQRRFSAEVQTTVELGESYQGDAGVLGALLLNRVTLNPGDGLYLPAGNLHAYLSGMAVEIMANSDNVLRGGLTPKHVDVAELLRVLDFSPVSSAELKPQTCGSAAEVFYRTPAKEFLLSRMEITNPEEADACEIVQDGPQILLCTKGVVRVYTEGAELTVSQGVAVWIPASESSVFVEGLAPYAQVFRATIG
ncbi:MAG: mannose-6-phosphate isomerase, class I [Mycobacteriaceae bacterium]